MNFGPCILEVNVRYLRKLAVALRSLKGRNPPESCRLPVHVD